MLHIERPCETSLTDGARLVESTKSVQCAVFQLQIDAVVVSYLAARILDVPIGEFFDAAVDAAQQILIEMKNSNIKDIV